MATFLGVELGTVHPLQAAVLAARLNYDMLTERVNERTKAEIGNYTNEEWAELSEEKRHEWIERSMQIAEELHHSEAFDILVQAEDALLEWARPVTKRVRTMVEGFEYLTDADIDNLFDKALEMGLKQKLVEICVKVKDPDAAG